LGLSRQPLRVPLVALAVVATALAAGCSGSREETPDLVNGKKLFVGEGTCGSCHALARAGTKGTQGPDLDQAFGPSRADGLGQGTIAGVVEQQIANVRRSSTMPEDLVTGKDARDVAAYVAAVAGMPGKDTGLLASAGAPEVSGKPAVAKGGTLEIPAAESGALAFLASAAQAKAGPLELVMPNPAPVPHNIAIEGAGVSEKGPVVNQGGTSKIKATVKAGKYTFLCTVPGHEAGGMKGELTVK
jgi:plastocyanin